MNIIVFGASGFIGYHLTKQLLDKGHTVYAFYNSSTGNLKYIENNQKLIIMNANKTESLIDSDISFDVWYHVAWSGTCGESRSDPLIQMNNEIIAVKAMYDALRLRCKKIIYTGTVYENIAESILKNKKFNKNSFYIIAKKHTREITYELSKKLGINYIWCSFCHPVGKFMNPNQMFPYAVNSFVNNNPTEFGSCSEYFDIMSVTDLINNFIILGQKDNKKCFYYLGSGNPRILREYLTEAAGICNYTREIGFGKRPDDEMIFLKEWFDCSEFEKEYNVNNKIKFKDIVDNLAEL